MKFSTFAAAAVAAAMPVLAAGVAHAAPAAAPAMETQGTLELGYTRANFSTDGLGDFGFNTIHGRGSVQLNKNWGAEMELGAGVGSDTVTVLGTPLDFKQQYEVAIYAVGYLPVGHDTDLMARVGYGRTRLTISGPGGSGDGEQKGVSAGVGFRTFPGGGANGIRADYTHYFYDGDTTGNAFSIGYVRRF